MPQPLVVPPHATQAGTVARRQRDGGIVVAAVAEVGDNGFGGDDLAVLLRDEAGHLLGPWKPRQMASSSRLDVVAWIRILLRLEHTTIVGHVAVAINAASRAAAGPS